MNQLLDYLLDCIQGHETSHCASMHIGIAGVAFHKFARVHIHHGVSQFGQVRRFGVMPLRSAQFLITLVQHGNSSQVMAMEQTDDKDSDS
ncbi:hypothetical protein ACUNV4_23800 [Granulosicoccus sp. 3-233]|uniref:hypothetical protein n=1 Tax=Granulosicoccus sp. 3-233 TaxID=3417969 RepID=UPI003D349112